MEFKPQSHFSSHLFNSQTKNNSLNKPIQQCVIAKETNKLRADGPITVDLVEDATRIRVISQAMKLPQRLPHREPKVQMLLKRPSKVVPLVPLHQSTPLTLAAQTQTRKPS
jgi:hypothetical protein